MGLSMRNHGRHPLGGWHFRVITLKLGTTRKDSQYKSFSVESVLQFSYIFRAEILPNFKVMRQNGQPFPEHRPKRLQRESRAGRAW